MPDDETEPERRYTMLTFEQAAAQLVADGHVRRMTAEGLRKAARSHPDWPVTDAQYGKAANARTLPYELAVHFVKNRRRQKKDGE